MTTQAASLEEIKQAVAAKLASGDIDRSQAAQILQRWSDNQQSETPKGGVASAILEPVKALTMGAAGGIASGWAGIGATLPGGRSPTEAIEATQGWFSDRGAPKTQSGQKSLETLGELTEMGVDIAQIPVSGLAGIAELVTGQGIDQAAQTVRDVQDKGIAQTAGDRAYEETGSPLFATAAYMAPEMLASVIPINRVVKKKSRMQTELADQLKNAEANPHVASMLTDMSASIRDGVDSNDLPNAIRGMADNVPPRISERLIEIASDAENGMTPASISNQLDQLSREAGQTAGDVSLVNYIRDGAGKAKNDPLAVEAIKQGWDDGVIASVKGSTSGDRVKMQQMTEIMDRGMKNRRFGMDNFPSDVAGKSLLDRVNHIKSINVSAGQELDSVAKGLRGKSVDFSQPVETFLNSLENIGVSLDGTLQPVFKGSDIEGIGAAESAIKNIINRMSSGADPTAYDLHRLKRYIDENVTYGKAGEGLKGQTERILKNLRADLDNTLDSQFPEYNRVNTEYSDTIRAMDSLQEITGSKLDLFGPNADKAVGSLLRRVMSRAQSRVPLMNSINEIESIARKYGGDFTDDVGVQILYADELDSVFGPAARTGFQSSVGQGVKQGIELATGQKTGIGMLAEVAGKVADKARGINNENAMEAIKKLLERTQE